MKFAYLLEDKIALIADAENIESLLPLDKKWQNLIDLSYFDPEPQVGWEFNGLTFFNPEDNSLAGNAANMKITKLAFLNRFTLSELVTYETALPTSVLLKVLDKKMFSAAYIDLARPDTHDGVNALASAGIITSSRANEILTVIPQEIELYRG